jgi:predicted PurR-regulated permease PerM
MANGAGQNSTTARRFTWLMFGGASLLLALTIAPLWRPLVVAAVIAGVVSPWYERLTKRWGGRRSLAATLFTLGTILLILLPLGGLLMIAIREALSAAEVVTKTLASSGLAGLVDRAPKPLAGWLRQLQRYLPHEIQKLQSQLAAGGRWALTTVTGTLAMLGHFAFQLALMLIAFFFLLRDGRALVDWLLRASPVPEGRARAVLDELRAVARSVLGANFITGAAQAAIATVGFLIAGAPSPIFFGLVTLITSMIPSIGSALGTLPVAALMLLTGHRWWALFLTIWALFVVGLIDNLLRPILIKSGAVRLHGALVFFSLIGAIGAFGAIGVFIGPLILTLFLATARQVRPAPAE